MEQNNDTNVDPLITNEPLASPAADVAPASPAADVAPASPAADVAPASPAADVAPAAAVAPPVPQVRLVDIPITDENISLNIMIAFLNVAQKRGSFSFDESAKVLECIRFFRRGPAEGSA